MGESAEELQQKSEMKPWEQHSAVISIPRFDYNAPTFLNHSLSGFLVTCPIKREKSATKEAISILGKYIETNETCGRGYLKECDVGESVKRRKLCTVEGVTVDANESELSKIEPTTLEITGNSTKDASNLVLVKVTISGLVLFTFPKGSTRDPVTIASLLNQSLESGSLKRPIGV